MTDTMHSAYLAAQKAMENPKRTAENPHFHSKFAPLEECLRVAKAALNANGITVSQPCVSEDGMIGVKTMLHHESGEDWDMGTLLLPAPSDPQKAGALVSYLRRYGLSSAIGLASDDDDDGNAAVPDKPVHEQKAAPSSMAATEKQVKMIQATAKALGYGPTELHILMVDVTGCESSKELTKSTASKLIDALKNREDAMKEAPEEGYDPPMSDTPVPF